MLNGCLFALVMFAQFAPSNTGELRVTVSDPSGLPVQSSVEIISQANQVKRTLQTDVQGQAVAKQLPFGTYQVQVAQEGFAPFSRLVDIRSATPTSLAVALGLAALQSRVDVSVEDTLVDPQQTGAVNRIGREAIQARVLALPGRSLPDLVSTQPGWLLEANGVLHPRGSEYQTQYVVDGLPLTDNRSPSFAPEIDADSVQSMGILTGGFPAEYGRKLGGIIEVVTAEDASAGFHGTVSASGGSFGTLGGDATGQYGWGSTTVSAGGGWSETDRYLDPPVEENYSNHGSGSHFSTRLDRSLGVNDRFGVIVRHGQSAFLVPNERIQQEAGQRQDRSGRETVAQFSFQHIMSGTMLWDARGMVRDLGARLWSNPAATPIRASQDRGLRESYLKFALIGHHGMHEWKLGGDADFGAVREQFRYDIADPDQFESGTPPTFAFTGRGHDHEQALFVQDRLTLGKWTASAGVRWDRYAFLVKDTAVSPRLAVAWTPGRGDFVVRASYDRAFQTPSFENLLLASSSSVETLSTRVVRLPVPPSRGNFYEAGFTKGFFGKLRLDATAYARRIANFADDDVLLNTGVTFPIAFRQADIRGTELKLTLPVWRGFSGFLSYANMIGVGYLPIEGGLLLGDATSALNSTDRFVVTQDQRNTAAARLMYQRGRASVALSTAYGSGLPVQFDGNQQDAIAQFGARVVNRVDFARGRVRPATTLDASIAYALSGSRNLRLQADVLNLTNSLRVINFAGVFSGTAIAPPRSVALRVQAGF
ncbi:MAG TPA: TonB-dependent receptor [Vicinamibacterales bacterium]|nr:TonB-dependent receptor [Vicinamibacterales bacterium]